MGMTQTRNIFEVASTGKTHYTAAEEQMAYQTRDRTECSARMVYGYVWPARSGKEVTCPNCLNKKA